MEKLHLKILRHGTVEINIKRDGHGISKVIGLRILRGLGNLGDVPLIKRNHY